MMKTYLLIVLYIAVLVAFYELIRWYGRWQLKIEHEYNQDYRTINKMIDEKEVSKISYDNIYLRIRNLKRLPFKNNEKTEVLIQKFCRKFGKIRIEKHLNGKSC